VLSLLLALLILVLPLAQQRSSWEFNGWSGFKVGPWVRMKTEVDLGGDERESEFKGTLLELSEMQAVVEQTVAETPPKKWTSDGDEEVDLGTKRMKCHWKEFRQGTNELKMWFGSEIPEGVAKFLVKNSRTTMMMQVVVWEKK